LSDTTKVIVNLLSLWIYCEIIIAAKLLWIYR